MEDQACPRCKTTKYRNPSLKLMVNICGHPLCESCVDLLFLKGSGSCPECQTPLRRINFRVQMFEDSTVEKEVDIRKRVLRDFNKKEEDFGSLREYNDYLEDIETIVYNLTNNIDVVETNKKIDQYKRENKELIAKNKSKLGKREHELEELLEMERAKEAERRAQLARLEVEAKKKKIRKKEALIDELMFSEADANNIVESFSWRDECQEKQQAEREDEEMENDYSLPKATQFSTGIQFGRNQKLMAMPEEGPLYSYRPVSQDNEGPGYPSEEELQSRGYILHVREVAPSERAGGFRASLACLRVLQEAMAGLYHGPLHHKIT